MANVIINRVASLSFNLNLTSGHEVFPMDNPNWDDHDADLYRAYRAGDLSLQSLVEASSLPEFYNHQAARCNVWFALDWNSYGWEWDGNENTGFSFKEMERVAQLCGYRPSLKWRRVLEVLNKRVIPGLRISSRCNLMYGESSELRFDWLRKSTRANQVWPAFIGWQRASKRGLERTLSYKKLITLGRVSAYTASVLMWGSNKTGKLNFDLYRKWRELSKWDRCAYLYPRQAWSYLGLWGKLSGGGYVYHPHAQGKTWAQALSNEKNGLVVTENWAMFPPKSSQVAVLQTFSLGNYSPLLRHTKHELIDALCLAALSWKHKKLLIEAEVDLSNNFHFTYLGERESVFYFTQAKKVFSLAKHWGYEDFYAPHPVIEDGERWKELGDEVFTFFSEGRRIKVFQHAQGHYTSLAQLEEGLWNILLGQTTLKGNVLGLPDHFFYHVPTGIEVSGKNASRQGLARALRDYRRGQQKKAFIEAVEARRKSIKLSLRTCAGKGLCFKGTKRFLVVEAPFIYRQLEQYKSWEEVPVSLLEKEYEVYFNWYFYRSFLIRLVG